MHTTSPSLMERLRRTDADDAWTRFVRLYTPLLYYWGHRAGLPEADTADLVQEVLIVLVQKLPAFRYDPGQSFRGWLRTVTLNKWREQARRRNPAAPARDEPDLSALAAPEPDPFDETEYRQQLVGRALQVMQAEFEPTTWKACWEFVGTVSLVAPANPTAANNITIASPTKRITAVPSSTATNSVAVAAPAKTITAVNSVAVVSPAKTIAATPIAAVPSATALAAQLKTATPGQAAKLDAMTKPMVTTAGPPARSAGNVGTDIPDLTKTPAATSAGANPQVAKIQAFHPGAATGGAVAGRSVTRCRATVAVAVGAVSASAGVAEAAVWPKPKRTRPRSRNVA